MTDPGAPSATRTAVGLFAGIGGLERGLHRAGFETELLSEIDPAAVRVLERRFPDVPVVGDVREIRSLPHASLVCAGFPCQDLSQAGRTAGIAGRRSGLVGEVFRLASRGRGPDWLLLENVPFMLQLERGRAMRFLTDALGELGYSWAYRVVDARAFGLPQRRQRVIILASRTEDPRPVLLAQDAGEEKRVVTPETACGFYWTEGIKGLGWAVDAVPTLKGGSTLGIPSPPAIWMPDGSIVTPDIRDAERLQGFPANWTRPSVDDPNRKNGPRWKLVGNAVSVPVAAWVGDRLSTDDSTHIGEGGVVDRGDRWPVAAWGYEQKAFRADVSPWPVRRPYKPLAEFLKYPTVPLSARAAAGFLARAERGSLRFPEGFLEDVSLHLELMSDRNSAA